MSSPGGLRQKLQVTDESCQGEKLQITTNTKILKSDVTLSLAIKNEFQSAFE